MTRYIQRHSTLKRWVHGIHMAACLVLVATGLFVFVPALTAAAGPEIVNALRIGHRIFAVMFIVVPLAGLVTAPKGFQHMLQNAFAKWDADDKTFMKLFLPYLFASKKIHMPAQHEIKSGQRVADGALVLAAVAISISGVILWIGEPVSSAALAFALLVHDISFFGIAILGVAHAYLGAGVFQPYRGMARVMFGDGKISEADALYHWGHWAKEELATGRNVVEE